MRLRDGQPTCALCGARLDIPISAKIERRITIAADGKRVSVLMLAGVEVHRCEPVTRSDKEGPGLTTGQISRG